MSVGAERHTEHRVGVAGERLAEGLAGCRGPQHQCVVLASCRSADPRSDGGIVGHRPNLRPHSGEPKLPQGHHFRAQFRRWRRT